MPTEEKQKNLKKTFEMKLKQRQEAEEEQIQEYTSSAKNKEKTQMQFMCVFSELHMGIFNKVENANALTPVKMTTQLTRLPM